MSRTNSDCIQSRLWAETDLTFAKALDSATAMALAAQRAADLQDGYNQGDRSVSTGAGAGDVNFVKSRSRSGILNAGSVLKQIKTHRG